MFFILYSSHWQKFDNIGFFYLWETSDEGQNKNGGSDCLSKWWILLGLFKSDEWKAEKTLQMRIFSLTFKSDKWKAQKNISITAHASWELESDGY